MISVDLSMEMRVGDLVMVTARVMNQKARKVIIADTSREAAEAGGMERGAVTSLLGMRRLQAREVRMENTPVVTMR